MLKLSILRHLPQGWWKGSVRSIAVWQGSYMWLSKYMQFTVIRYLLLTASLIQTLWKSFPIYLKGGEIVIYKTFFTKER